MNTKDLIYNKHSDGNLKDQSNAVRDVVTDNETISYVDQAGLSDKFVESDENVTVNLEVKNPLE